MRCWSLLCALTVAFWIAGCSDSEGGAAGADSALADTAADASGDAFADSVEPEDTGDAEQDSAPDVEDAAEDATPVDADAGEDAAPDTDLPDVPEPVDTEDALDTEEIEPDVPECLPCEEGEVCKEGACVPVVCTPGETLCVNGTTVAKCDPFGAAFYPSPCAPGYQCYQGKCTTAEANILILFDTSSSMNTALGSTNPKPYPVCEDPESPATKLGLSKKAFNDILGKDLANPARFSLSRFPQNTAWSGFASCPSGYVSSVNLMTGDPGTHASELGAAWFEEHHGQVVVVPFGEGTGNNAAEVLEWMDFDEQVHVVPDVPCSECDGMCAPAGCAVFSNPEIRTGVGTPLGRSMYYAGEYIRQKVAVEGKPCAVDADCGNSHFLCDEGSCHDPAGSCRETVLVVFTDGAESMNTSPTDFFNPVNQAKRMFLGLSCAGDEGCAPGAKCIAGTCAPAVGGDQFDILNDPAIGVCDNSLTPCTLAGPVECEVGQQCKDVKNTFSDAQGVQTLTDWSGNPLRVRVHVIDASTLGGEANPESNRDTALFGGGEYIPVNAAVTAELIEAIAVVTDPKPNISCF
jgi:hypothetical protein